jgi:nucleotide-binding universal stress UspA family protein
MSRTQEDGMSIKEIVTIIDLEGEQPAARVAAGLAARLDAHVVGMAPVADPFVSAYLAGPMPGGVIDAARERAREEAGTALSRFRDIADAAGVRAEDVTFELVEGTATSLIARSRLSDLIVVGQEQDDMREPGRGLIIESLLFDTGRPVLVVPYIFTGDFSPDHVGVAWDGGHAAATAVGLSLPLLSLAKRVTVLVMPDSTGTEEPGADVAAYLARHGLEVEVSHAIARNIDVAASLLNTASDSGMDMLVMGAYGHSRLREFILGGATRHMLGQMTVPTLMAH